MKRHFSVLIVFLISVSAFAQIKERKKIDSLFSSWNKPDVPGGALGIIKDGKLIYSKGYGMADLEHDIKITPASVFYIGSVSKQFVTFCILLLEEQGKLNLDDRIQKYLPDFPEYQAPLTIRHFIHHTSGVRDYLTLMHLKGKSYLDNLDGDEVYSLITRQKELNFTPGEKYLYSNSCYFMLAMIVERASGQSIKQFAQVNIFQPLGMKHTRFYDDNTELVKNRVFSYEKKNNQEGFNNLIMRFDLVGSGGVYSTVEDLFLWDQNFYNNKLGKGGEAIISRMHEEGKLNNGESSGYAFALVNDTYKGLKTVSHGGALAGYRAQLLRFPDEKFSVVILANRSDANPESKAFGVAEIFLKEKLSQTPNKKPAAEDSKKLAEPEMKFSLKQVAGNYEVQRGVSVEISIRNDSLWAMQSWNQASYPLIPTGGNTYGIHNEPGVQFTFSELKDGSTQRLVVIQDGRETSCKRIKSVDAIHVTIEDYTGNYYCDELDVTYSISSKDGKLLVKVANYPVQEFSLYGKDILATAIGTFRFQRTDGLVKGFELDAGRVTNLKFIKK